MSKPKPKPKPDPTKKPEFPGFGWPKENWFRLPNEWTNITRKMTLLAEMKVVEYILRHTWGYKGDRSKFKTISLDEFCNGRKRKDRTRMDGGTGMSKPAIRRGIKIAIAHGFLEKIVIDDSDRGRIKTGYRLRMKEEKEEEEQDDTPEQQTPSFRDNDSIARNERSVTPIRERYLGKTPEELIPSESTRGKPADGPGDEPPGDAAMQPRPARPDRPPRSNGTKGRGRPPLRNGPPSSNGKPASPGAADPPEPLDGNDGFARKAARYLHKTLADSRSNLVFPGGKRRPVTVERLEKDSILPLLTNGVATRGQIRELLTWHRTWHSETYTPRIGASGDLYARWDKLRDAMERWRGRTSNGDGRADGRVPEGPSDEERRDTLNMRVRAEMAERCTEEDMAAYTEVWNALNRRYGCRDRAPLVETQGQVDDVLEGLGLDRGRFPLEWFLHRR